ncbi:MAG: TIGR00730 family Rossman fold protein [Paludibacteraceae bacterium]|nr:TIGR00730 family Rossman fold protein [Paludibacteraceae bacterium]
MVKTVCVYCAASAKANQEYLSAAEELGKYLSKHNVHCVYGGGHVGLMGSLADSMIKHNGEITGIIPRFMQEENWNHKGLKNLIVTETMHERKARMASMSDAAIALPGGCGTMEELLEIITWKQLGLYPKPIIIVNIEGYFNPLIEMLKKAIEEKFMKAEHAIMWQVVSLPDQVLAAIENESKWEYNTLNFAVI